MSKTSAFDMNDTHVNRHTSKLSFDPLLSDDFFESYKYNNNNTSREVQFDSSSGDGRDDSFLADFGRTAPASSILFEDTAPTDASLMCNSELTPRINARK
jgi:hypothetical protein